MQACHPYGGKTRLSRESLESDVAESLERLGTSYLDVVLLHRDDPSVEVDSIVQWMHALVQRGSCRAWGTSNWSPDRLRKLSESAVRQGLTPPTADSPQRSLARPRIPVWPDTTCADEAMVAAYREQDRLGIGCDVLGWAPLANGFLAGRWSLEDTRRGLSTAYGEGRMIDAFVTQDNLARRERAAALSRRLHASPAQIAVAYALTSVGGRAPFVVLGTSQVEHLYELVRGCVLDVSPSDVSFLEGENLHT